MEGRTPPHSLGACDQRYETSKGYPRVLHCRTYHRYAVIGKNRIGVKHAHERRAGRNHSTINRRRPPASGVLDQSHSPALAHKRGRVVLASAIDRDDFRRRGMKDSEQTKQSRYDCRLIQNRDDECNIVKPFAFSEHWPPLPLDALNCAAHANGVVNSLEAKS